MRPLEGITVLDFGFYLAGPVTARLLADLGARVIKVEEVTGDPRRGIAATFLFVQRGKEDIALNLKTDEGRRIVYQLVERADVVVHNMRVGVAERLGIDYETLRAINPRLIYCHNAGYGSRGPGARDPVMEPLHSALAGFLHLTGGRDNPPLRYLSNMDLGCGLNGALTIVMALYERTRSGQGQYVEAPQNGASMVCSSDVYFVNGEKSRHLDLDHDQMGHGPLNRLYRTADDGWICLSARPQRDWVALCAALELPYLREDSRFRTAAEREQHAEALIDLLTPHFLARTAAEWLAILDAAGVPCEIPQDRPPGSFVNDPDHLASGAAAEYVHPRFGRIREIGVPIGFSETPGRNEAPAPLLGQNTRQILSELGYGSDDIAALREKGVVGWEEAVAPLAVS
jgi:crotonobetainyl-CoA:carnitine CoA-transferase CaiB-like acyl-CoA transferase